MNSAERATSMCREIQMIKKDSKTQKPSGEHINVALMRFFEEVGSPRCERFTKCCEGGCRRCEVHLSDCDGLNEPR